MFCCYPDPGFALFLSESPAMDEQDERALAWVGAFTTLFVALGATLAVLA